MRPESRDTLRSAWTTTSVGLATLLLTFFAMVFAMSIMDQQRPAMGAAAPAGVDLIAREAAGAR